MLKQTKKILVSGSIVYDRIMTFPGFFQDHIIAGQTHILNVSFTLKEVKESFGGTGGNIAYNLSLLKKNPILLGLVGSDFGPYQSWLTKNKVDLSQLKTEKNQPTASAYIMTDKSDNQISGFYPGPTDARYCQRVLKIKDAGLAIISPDFKLRMLEYVQLYKKIKLPYIFDPGQQISSLSPRELKSSISGAKVLIGNDYEVKLISDKTKLSISQLEKLVEILVITRGAKGSEIYSQNKKIKIKPVKVKKNVDPTGAGDAYRAGFIAGFIDKNDLRRAGQIGSLLGAYAVEHQGTQEHYFSLSEFKKRYKNNYQAEL